MPELAHISHSMLPASSRMVLAVDVVTCKPFSARLSLLTGKNTGNFTNYGLLSGGIPTANLEPELPFSYHPAL